MRHEAVHNCVERVFGVRFKRFTPPLFSCELWNREKTISIAHADVVGYNMIVEQRRKYYKSDGAAALSTTHREEHDECNMYFWVSDLCTVGVNVIDYIRWYESEGPALPCH